MATVDSIKVIAYQREYTKMSNKYINESVFVSGSGDYSIMAVNDSSDMAASGTYSYAEGYNTQAIGIESHAEGSGSVAVGESSHSEGSQSIASGNFSHAEGYDSKAVGETSHSEGYHSMAIGTSSHAEGKGLHDFVNLTGNNGTYSFPKRYINFKKRQALYDINNDNYTIITSVDQTNHTLTTLDSLGELNNSSFEVYSNYVLGDSSHTEGSSNAVLSKAAHAEGLENMVSGNFSHVEGMGNTVSGQVSHAEGSYTIASGANQHVAGRYNVEDLNNTYAEIIGIGATDTARKNGRTLDWSGNEQLAGSLTLGLGTTDQITVTAAQLKQLIALLGG